MTLLQVYEYAIESIKEEIRRSIIDYADRLRQGDEISYDWIKDIGGSIKDYMEARDSIQYYRNKEKDL